ncbi:unnamed protein product [Adineta steineri]|uniref:Uncharacterized protein n=1 Tax=Adineta steineri TaxID=433720 RepID=A0A815AHI3_9BILA|nr:unnamed protein product [Adineta steineri]CAF1546077.1 unnamed protein product [Adineta steineri]
MALDYDNHLLDVDVDDDYFTTESLFDGIKNYNKLSLKRPKPTLICVVCGDNAFGYNFDAVSCESCKAFFRRNALRPPGKLKCRGNGHCEVTVEKRKRCKKCRLDKCLSMGMRKEWILSEEEKRRKRSKIQENRRRKQTNENGPVRRRRSNKSVKTEDVSSGDTFNPPKTDNDDNPPMTDSDWVKIHQVQFAYSQSITLNKVIGVAPYPATQHINSTLELIRIPTYLSSIRLITYMKNIPEFDLLDSEDRVVLVKYNLLAVVFMHIVLIYDPIADTYHEHNTEDPIFQGKDWVKILGEEFYNELTDVAKKLIEICQYDRVIIKIFLLLILSTKGFCGYDIVHEPTLKNHSTVFDVQNGYVEALYKYCLHQYGFTKTVNLFTHSLNSLLSIQRLAVHLKDIVHDHIDPSELSPLMQSVLQLTDPKVST